MSEFDGSVPELERRSVIISRATPGDAGTILKIKRDAWLGAYVNEERGVTAEDIKKRMGDMSIGIENWQRGLANEAQSNERATFVARVDNEIVGYTSPHIIDGQRRIGALYVSPKAQGKGVGTGLLDRAVEWYGREHDIFLHVLNYNQNALGFYERYGFEKTGKEIADEPEHGITLPPEIEMVLRANSKSE
jgi:GNAT superfamily N-acetyltransferase